MGQKITKKLPKTPKWQKPPKPPQRHVAKPGEAGRSVVTSIFIREPEHLGMYSYLYS